MRATLLFVFLTFCGIVKAEESPQRAPGQLIIQLHHEVSVTDWIPQNRNAILHQAGFKFNKTLFNSLNIHLFEFTEDAILFDDLISELQLMKDVKHVQGDHKVEFRMTPNDPEFINQWALETIRATDVWNFTQGGTTVQGDEIVIAVVDDGFDHLDADLIENVWVNKGEIPNDDIDNDNNGYVDDYYGLNVSSGDDNHVIQSHGTNVAGIAGAKGDNGIGIVGVNWNVKLMLVSGIRFESEIIEAFEYVLSERQQYNSSNGSEGSYVVALNGSFGIPEVFAEDYLPWCQTYDALGQVGILSIGATSNAQDDVDLVGDMPSTCNSPYLLIVTNTDQQDLSRGGFGFTSVDLGAPGDGSTSISGEFGGTSAAAPHVAGGVGLLYGLPCNDFISISKTNPGQATLAIKEAILSGVDPITSLGGISTTGGRLNLYNSMLSIGDFCEASVGDLAITKITPNPAISSSITVSYETPNFESYELVVYDATGKILLYDELIPTLFSKKEVIIETFNYQSGVYHICIYGSEENACSSFIVF